MVQVGAGKRKIIIPEEILPIEKFHKVHDDIHARVLCIRSDEDFVLVSLELTSLREYEIRKLRRMISERLNIQEKYIWICVTHTFSAPHTRSEKQLLKPEIRRTNDCFCQALEQAVEEALTEAVHALQEAQICCLSDCSDVNINRDEETPDGWWLGFDDSGFSDKTLPVVCFKDPAGKPIAVLYNYDVQSSIMDNVLNSEGYRHISGDLAGRASRYVEERYPGSVVFFLLGAAGDQAPRLKAQMDARKKGTITEAEKDALYSAGFAYIDKAGAELGRDVVRTVENNNCNGKENICRQKKNRCKNDVSRMQLSRKVIVCDGQVPPADMHDLHATRSYNYRKNGQLETPIDILILEDMAFIGVQPELCSITASQIRKESPYPLTFVMTMVNGIAKYMADEKSYERMSYEAMNSGFGKGSAELLRDEAIRLLKSAESE
ncbi:MAG: hypothetical protein SOW08_01205 [Lachnospiraceae bacterium]|nr:hypothetical protein [Lachnospiraceae bacterium]